MLSHSPSQKTHNRVLSASASRTVRGMVAAGRPTLLTTWLIACEWNA